MHRCNGRLIRLVAVGTGLAPLMVGKASPPPSWHALLVQSYRRAFLSRILSKPRLISVKRASINGSNSQSVKM